MFLFFKDLYYLLCLLFRGIMIAIKVKLIFITISIIHLIFLVECVNYYSLFCFTLCLAPPLSQPCDAGFACAPGLVSVDGAVACSLGSYCARASGNETDCAVGQFCPTPNVTYACSQGSYCPARSTAQAVCPAGHYCYGVNQTQCEGGYLCSGGAVATDKGLVFTLAGNKVGGYRIDGQGVCKCRLLLFCGFVSTLRLSRNACMFDSFRSLRHECLHWWRCLQRQWRRRVLGRSQFHVSLF